MIKKEKGITLISLIITIAVMIIISSITVSTSLNRFEINNFNKMKNDIELLSDKVANYYIQYKGLPVLRNAENNLLEYPTTSLNFNKNLNDNDTYFILDLEAMEGISLNYGKDGYESIKQSKTVDTLQDIDVYIINEESYQIYYVKGIEMDGILYHTIQLDENIIDDTIPPSKPQIKVVSGEKDIDDAYYTNIQLEFVPGIDKTSEIEKTTYSVNGETETDIKSLTNNMYTISTDGTYEIKVKSYDNEGNYREEIQSFTKKTMSIALNKSTISKEAGKGSMAEENLTATVTNLKGELTWKSSDVTIASISGEGTTRIIELRNEGTTTITVNYGTISTTCAITVTDTVPKIEVNEKAEKPSTIDGLMYSATNPVIPKGFMAIDTQTSTWRDTSKYKNGLVISDGNSEFVWIPVGNLNKFARLQDGSNTDYRGVLNTFTSTGYNEITWSADYTGYREPGVVSNFDGSYLSSFDCTQSLDDDTDVDIDDLKILLQSSFNKMVESVAKYKGFYVGRYETSLNGTVAQSKAGETSANATSSSANRWYGLYQKSKTYSSSNSNLGVESEMIWGCQYDAMLIWMQSNNILVTSRTPIDTARGVAASSNTTSITGATDSNDILNNVYDVIGNKRDWTQELNGSSNRAFRGGADRTAAPSIRDAGYPTGGMDYYGSRLSLYVKVNE